MGRVRELYVVRRLEGEVGHYTYYLFRNGTPVAYVAVIPAQSEAFGGGYRGRAATNPELDGNGLRVISIYLDPQVRGTGLSLELYKWLLDNACDYIFPDDLQTRGGVWIWKQMLKDPRFEVWIYNHEKYEYYRARPGAVWANVYKTEALRPYLILAGTSDEILPH